MHELTFLETDQIFGSKALDIIKKRGAAAPITDFSILRGGWIPDTYYNSMGRPRRFELDKRPGWYWTKTDNKNNHAYVIDHNGIMGVKLVYYRSVGARACLKFSDCDSIPTNNGEFKTADDGIVEVEYGYYPRKAAPKTIQEQLNTKFEFAQLTKTGNIYTTDAIKSRTYYESFLPKRNIEYEFNQKRYIKVRANIDKDSLVILSNEEKYKCGDYVWVEVEPVKWLVDEKEKIMITEELIFSGVQFNNESNYIGDFENTDIKKFMNRYLSKELFQNSNTINVDNNNDIITVDEETTILTDKIIKYLYLNGCTKEQITTIGQNILSHTTPTKTEVKQKLKTPNK